MSKNKFKKQRVGVIGAGWWAVQNHIPALIESPIADLCAVCRIGEEELRQVQQKFQVPYASEDYKCLFSEVELDAVIISSPHYLHYEHAKAALEKGLHVLVEKPFTTNPDHAWELVRLARDNGCIISVPCGWNFSAMGLAAKELVDSVGIGQVEHVNLQMASALSDLFSGQPMIETKGAMFRPSVGTWAKPEQAGGYAWGQLSHALSMLYSLFDVRVEEVNGACGRSEAGVDQYDAAVVRFDNGATGVMSGAATVPKHCGFQMDIRVFGNEGMFLFDVERERVEIRRHDGSDRVIEFESGDGAYDGIRPVFHFLELCAGLSQINPSGGEVAARAVETLSMLYSQFDKNR